MMLLHIPIRPLGEDSVVFLRVVTALPSQQRRPRDEEGTVLQGLGLSLSEVRISASKAMRFLRGKMI